MWKNTWLHSYTSMYIIINIKREMRYGWNGRPCETRKNIRIYMDFFGKIILNCTLVSPNLGVRWNFVATQLGVGLGGGGFSGHRVFPGFMCISLEFGSPSLDHCVTSLQGLSNWQVWATGLLARLVKLTSLSNRSACNLVLPWEFRVHF